MKSFRHIAIFLGLAALLAGCVKAEIVDVPERPVSFSVGSYAPATRTSVSLDTYGINSFKSKGFLHAEGYENITQDFFGANGETISKSGNDWVPSHPYYWPKSELSYVNFVSWYDRNGNPTTVDEDAMEWNGRTIVYNDDIMFADKAWHYNSGSVATLFHHALAQVKFQARLSEAVDGNTSWTVSISNFKVENVHKTGSLSLRNSSDPNLSWATTPWTDAVTGSTPTWRTTEAVDTLSHNGQYTLTAANQVVMNTRTVLPQTTFGLVLSFDYEINTSYNIEGNPITSVSEKAHATINMYSDFSIRKWDMNTRTTYTLVFNPKTSKIMFEPVLTEDWNTDLNNSIYIE